MNPAPETPKRPRGSRGGRRVQELREKGELPAAGSKAAVRLNAKRDKARKFAEKKAEKKARRAQRLELRKANTGSTRSESAAEATSAFKIPEPEAIAKAFSAIETVVAAPSEEKTSLPSERVADDKKSSLKDSDDAIINTSRKAKADPESIVKKSSTKHRVEKKKKNTEASK